MDAIELRSDNSVGVAPEVLAAVAAADVGGVLGYGADPWTAEAEANLRRLFDHEHLRVFPVVSGTAANALGLAAAVPPWGAVICHETAHILVNEGGATSMFTGGALMTGLPGPEAKLTVEGLEAAMEGVWWGDPHQSQPAALSLTQPTDRGTLYTPDEVSALAGVARDRGMRVHLDGARLANAVAALGCHPADVSWRAGVDVLSFGLTKNGALSTDAIVCFDPEVAEQLVYRTKRAGHVASKMRFQSTQISASVADGLWLRLADRANRAMAHLVAGLDRLGVELVHRPAVNMAFVRLDEASATRWQQAGLLFYTMGPGLARLVTSFRSTLDEMDEALARIEAARA